METESGLPIKEKEGKKFYIETSIDDGETWSEIGPFDHSCLVNF